MGVFNRNMCQCMLLVLRRFLTKEMLTHFHLTTFLNIVSGIELIHRVCMRSRVCVCGVYLPKQKHFLPK